MRCRSHKSSETPQQGSTANQQSSAPSRPPNRIPPRVLWKIKLPSARLVPVVANDIRRTKISRAPVFPHSPPSVRPNSLISRRSFRLSLSHLLATSYQTNQQVHQIMLYNKQQESVAIST